MRIVSSGSNHFPRRASADAALKQISRMIVWKESGGRPSTYSAVLFSLIWVFGSNFLQLTGVKPISSEVDAPSLVQQASAKPLKQCAAPIPPPATPPAPAMPNPAILPGIDASVIRPLPTFTDRRCSLHDVEGQNYTDAPMQCRDAGQVAHLQWRC